MIINDGSYAPSTTVTTPTVTTVLTPSAGAKVKKELANSADVAAIAAALTGMVDIMVNGVPSAMRVNGKVMPPREKRWVR